MNILQYENIAWINSLAKYFVWNLEFDDEWMDLKTVEWPHLSVSRQQWGLELSNFPEHPLPAEAIIPLSYEQTTISLFEDPVISSVTQLPCKVKPILLNTLQQPSSSLDL